MVDKGYVYVLGGGGISVLDVSNPAQPRQVGGSDYSGGQLAIAGAHIYVAGGASGLLVLKMIEVP